MSVEHSKFLLFFLVEMSLTGGECVIDKTRTCASLSSLIGMPILLDILLRLMSDEDVCWESKICVGVSWKGNEIYVVDGEADGLWNPFALDKATSTPKLRLHYSPIPHTKPLELTPHLWRIIADHDLLH